LLLLFIFGEFEQNFEHGDEEIMTRRYVGKEIMPITFFKLRLQLIYRMEFKSIV